MMSNTVTQQKFILGSDWIYYKIYTGVNTADSILSNSIAKITDKLIEAEIIDQWFFIRYTDPDFHIRLRLHMKNPKQIDTLISILFNEFNPLLSNNLIWKISTDTYARELIRYGFNTIEDIEYYFFYDSQMVIQSIKHFKSDSQRLIFITKAVNELINSFKIDGYDKIKFLEGMAKAFKNEFHTNKTTNKGLATQYKNISMDLKSFLSDRDLQGELLTLRNLIEIRDHNIRPIVDKILRHQRNNTLQLPLNDLLASLIHMLVNKAFRSKQRQYEMVVYDFLCKYSKMKMARKNA